MASGAKPGNGLRGLPALAIPANSAIQTFPFEIRMKSALLMILAAAALAACMPRQRDSAALPGKMADMYNSRNSLDWAAAD